MVVRYTDEQKRAWDEMPTIGYWSDLGVVEVKKMEHGIDDYIVCIEGTSTNNPKYHRVKVQYTPTKNKRSRAYIVLNWTKLYMDDLFRL